MGVDQERIERAEFNDKAVAAVVINPVIPQQVNAVRRIAQTGRILLSWFYLSVAFSRIGRANS